MIRSTPSVGSFFVGRVITRIFFAILLMFFHAPGALAQAQQKPDVRALLHRIYATDEYQVKVFGPARWLSGGEAYTTVEPSAAQKGALDIVRYDTATGKREIMVSAAELIPPGEKPALHIENYAWSADRKRLLIFTNSRQVWRQNTRGDYWVLDRETHALRKLGGDAAASTLMFAKFSPDGSRIAYVRANNIYVEELRSGKITPLTSDGSETTINGTSDWVYEEEFGVRDGFRWSPDGTKIAYWQFDTRGVEDFRLIYNLGVVHQVVTSIPYPRVGVYPAIFDIRYPETGTTNPAARVGVVSSGGETRWMQVPGDPRDNYIARMDWGGDSSDLVLQHLNRLQNTDDVLLADAETGAVRTINEDHDSAWVDVMHEIPWMDGGKEFVWLSEKDGWRHAYSISRDAKRERLLTHGSFDVVSLAGVDEKAGWLYYIASPDNATQRYLYRVRLDGSNAERVTPADSTGTNSYDISPDGQWAFHTRSTFDTPPVTDLVELATHRKVRVLEDNAALLANAAPILKRPVEFFHVDIGDGVVLDGWMLKPPDFDPLKKYPLLIYVYGEPASTTVRDEWDEIHGLYHHLVATEGYIVASADNRGTPAPKGRAWRKVIYGTVGVLSSKEQAAALEALERIRSYIDADRVAVWGWSGGGSNTLNLMFRSPDLYKVGISVAPVPDQRLYDTIYQERYMGLPQQNVEGYRAGSPINFAEGLRGKLLLVHGTGDDNVHFQGSELLINRLIELGKPFDFMEYPSRTHAINEGPGTSFHLRSLLIRYLEEHLPAGPRAQ
ncbi:MAG: S9 family peptidase [Candidatus Acidiferrales bacterium]